MASLKKHVKTVLPKGTAVFDSTYHNVALFVLYVQTEGFSELRLQYLMNVSLHVILTEGLYD